MSFLTAIPAELAAAAAQLGAIGSAMAAQSAGAAAPTTAIAPAAADQVSIIQSSIFTAYGALYQQLQGEAQAIHDQFVQTLGLSSGTYEQSESANAAAAALSAASSAAPTDPVTNAIDNLAILLGGPLTSTGGQPFSLSGNMANVSSYEIGNFASASSNMLGLTSGGLMPEGYGVPEDLADAAAAASAATPAATAGAVTGMGGAPISAAIGGSTLVGSMSVPPSWAAGTTLVSSSTIGALPTTGWTAAAPAGAATGGFYPGMPGMASAARNSAGFGAPRYGVKPIVMPKAVSV